MNLEQLTAYYQANQAAIDLVSHTKITLLVGISGAGKDTIKRELLKQSDYQDIVSHTTRAPRSNNGVVEIADVDYYFIDLATAQQMIEAHQFIEVKYVHGTIYGTSMAQLQLAHDEHKIAITDLDVQGVDEYKQLSRDVVAIFILPPDYATWRARLAARYASPEAFAIEWPKRRTSAIRELTYALEVPYYHFVVNDQLARAVEVIDEIAHQEDVFHRKDDEVRLRARDLLAAIQAND